MPRTGERGGAQTRARIAEVASGLFFERGFEAVTVAEVARAAGVSSVTVFKHFPTKEDLFLDRSEDAVALLREAAGADDVLAALHATARGLAADRHPLSGLDGQSVAFLRTVADSPALLARARAIAADLQAELTAALGDGGELLAAFFVAGYGVVLTATVRRLLAGESADALSEDHLARVEELFTALRGGVTG